MKKSLLLGITGITLVAVTATTLYAQTVAGSSIVDKMKAAMRPSFTLSADLNPGQTGFESAPITGKKTGNMLTAAEWNRMLEILANGGSGISDVEVVTSQDVWAAAGTSYANRWSEAKCPAWKKIISGGCSYPNTRNSFIHNAPKSDLSGWNCWGIAYNGDISSTSAEYPTRPTAHAVCGTYGGGGGSSSSSSTSGSPLFYYCTNAQSLDSTNAPCYGASRNQGLWDGRYRVVSCHIIGSTGHESINSQLLNFGRTGLAAMQNKWNSLYTDSQWQLCIDGSVLVADTQAISTGGSSAGGGDKFTFVDSDILVFGSWLKKTDNNTPTPIDLSTVAGVTVPANAKAVQLYVYCANYTSQNEGVHLKLGRSSTAMMRACAQNVFGAANDVDTNTVIVPLADDKKTIYYSYTVPATENGGQVAFYLRGFITE